jgi:opacity protein-like surface antigen
MTTYYSSALAFLLAGTLAATSATAADSGFYVRLDNGVQSISGAKIEGRAQGITVSGDAKFQAAYIFGGAIGYNLGSDIGPIALELEIDHASNKLSSIAGVGLGTDVSLEQTSALANVLYKTKLTDTFALHFSAGLGAQFHRNNLNSFYTNAANYGSRKDDTVLIAQLKPGVSFQLTNNLSLDAAYKLRFVGDSDGYSGVLAGTAYTLKVTSHLNHLFTAGLTYKF